MLLRAYLFFSKFHKVCTSQPPKIWALINIQAWRTPFDFPPFWIASKQVFYKIKIMIPKNAEFKFMGKNEQKMCFKRSYYLLNYPGKLIKTTQQPSSNLNLAFILLCFFFFSLIFWVCGKSKGTIYLYF